MTPIEKIRADVRAVHERHYTIDDDVSCAICSDAVKPYGSLRCDAQIGAQDKMKLAMTLEAIIDSHAHNCTCLAHRILAEVAR